MVRQRNPSRTRAVKQRSFILTILAGLGHLLRLFAGWIYRHARKNPLMACGFFLFLVGFSFVTFNALFYQSASHHAVFIETRPLAVQTSAGPNRSVSAKPDAQSNTVTSSSTPSSLVKQPVVAQKENTASADKLPDNLLDVQKKLAAMGLYDGPLDGLDGPKTRNAVALWRQKTNSANSLNLQTKPQDDIASLISGAIPQNGTVDRVTTQSLNNQQPATNNVTAAAPTIQSQATNQQSAKADNNFKADTTDIMQVQAALRAFGDDNVVVTGEEDDNTAEALKKFQKMFSLTVTGKVNQEVIDKMKDIGLIG